jgi:site-specific DNA-cytosine methylase
MGTGGHNVPLKSKDLTDKLSPNECEALQGVPNNYTEGVSNTQRYKMLGNGWTVPVIAHIFSSLKD